MSAAATKGLSRWVVVARVLRPQGRRGEVLAELLTDFPEQLIGREGLRLAPADYEGDGTGTTAGSVTESWLPKGKNEGRIVLTLAGIESIDAAEVLTGWELIVRAEDRIPLEVGAAYVSDLVGCTVLDSDCVIGKIFDVQFPTTADGRRRLDDASPLLVVRGATQGEILVPFVRAYLLSVDLDARQVRMALPAGLLNLNGDAGDNESEAAGEP